MFKPENRISIRTIIFWILIITFLWVVVSRFTEIKKLVETLGQGQWGWVLVAAVLQVIYYIIYTEQYRSAFHTVDVGSRLFDLLPVTFASIFVNVVTPTGGASGAALFIDDASRRGQSTSRAAVGTLLALITDLTSFTLVLFAGLIYLFFERDLKSYEIGAAIVLLLITGSLTGILLVGMSAPAYLQRLFLVLQRFVNRFGAVFRKTNLLIPGWAEKQANEFTEAALAIKTYPERLTRTLLVALSAQALDLASLYALFLAFHQKVGLGTLVAGYAVGILFWIVSITPQGIGVVEGAMTLVYTSLGVPPEPATVISLAFRGLTFWLPMAIGFFTLHHLKSFKAKARYLSQEIWSIRIVAILTGVMGIINVLSAVTPSLASRVQLLARFSPLEIRQGGHLSAALAGFALLLLAGNLWRRKRNAWALTLIILSLSVISHMLKGLDYEESALAASLGIWLFTLRAQFHARSDTPSFRQGLKVLVGAILFTLLYGVTGFYLLDHHYSVTFNLGDSLRQTIVMFTQFSDPGLYPITNFGRYFADSIYIIAALTIAYALIQVLRPVLLHAPATLEERLQAREIVQSYGRSALARLSLLTDKSYYFSPGGSVIAFTTKGHTAVTLGDPKGPVNDIQGAIRGYAQYCATNDWQSAFYQVLPDFLELYRSAGFDVLCIGQEAIVDLETFTIKGHENKGLRSAVNRLTKLGYQAQVIEPPIPEDILRELRAISDEWLTSVHGTEKRFSVGWFDEDYLRDGPIILIRTHEGFINAFANIIPEYRLNEISIDLMRRRRETDHGIMDLLFYSLILWGREKGFATFNLGLSALSGIGERAEDPAVERAMHYIYEHINRFYNFKGLHEFKEKFHPQWSPRYLIFPGAASLPAVWIAILRADSGDNLLGDYLADLFKKYLSPTGPKVRL